MEQLYIASIEGWAHAAMDLFAESERAFGGDEIIRFADRPNNHHHPARIAPSQSVRPSFRGAVIILSFLGRREPPTQEEARRVGRKSGWSRSARNRAGITEINKTNFKMGIGRARA